MTKTILRTLLIPATFAAFTASAQTIQVNQNNRTIAVTVSDKATAEADIATVHIGFETYAPDANTAYSAGSQTSNAIIDALHKAAIEDKAIQSEGQELRQNFQFDPKESEADHAKKQFVLTQSWTVKTSAAGAKNVLHAAIEAGANNSGQIDWDVKDHATLQAQAAAKALQHARAIANQMAQGLNARVGPLLYASNQMPETGKIAYGVAGGVVGRLSMSAKAIPLAINPQQIEENATVYAVFQIQ